MKKKDGTRYSIGEKRNLCCSLAKHEYIVHMDDDDYYPPTRIEHAVSMLTKSKHLVAGSSEIYIYFKHIK